LRAETLCRSPAAKCSCHKEVVSFGPQTFGTLESFADSNDKLWPLPEVCRPETANFLRLEHFAARIGHTLQAGKLPQPVEELFALEISKVSTQSDKRDHIVAELQDLSDRISMKRPINQH
jgi:hypothetical protein